MYWLIPLAAIFVSIVVTIVQYAQWRTANQKVVIALHERRFTVYSQIEKAVQAVLREGEPDHEDMYEFTVGQSAARFLFGDDVRSYLQDLREHLAWLVSFNSPIIEASPQREQLIEEKYNRLKYFFEFFDRSPEIFAPYLRLDQKISPFWRPW